MKPENKDQMRELFSQIEDERLPFNFNEKVMLKVRKEALLREKRKKRWEIFGYISGAVVMLFVCVILLYSMGISFDLPEFEPRTWVFPKPDFTIFGSQSFTLSVYVGVLALLLLIADSTIRRHIEKTKQK